MGAIELVVERRGVLMKGVVLRCWYHLRDLSEFFF